jgi:aminomethyltransferase
VSRYSGIVAGNLGAALGSCEIPGLRYSVLSLSNKKNKKKAATSRSPLPQGKSMALRTPLFDWHVAHGGRIVEFGGWDMPVQFTSIGHEHAAVRTKAGLFDISHMGRLSFGGAGSLDLIQQVFTNNAATMKDMQVRYGLVCNEAGGIRDDVLVYRWPYGWAMVVNASNREKILGWLKEHQGGRDVQIMDQTLTTGMLALQGPEAVKMARGLVPIELEKLGYYFAAPTKYRDKNCVVSRTGYTGEDGLEFMVPGDLTSVLADELLSRGALPCGLGARDTLRLEAAMPLYGHELSEEIDPLQAGLAWAVKLDKGDFIGRDAILGRKDAVRPVRVGLEVEGRRAAREGAGVIHDGKPIGKVTSGSLGPTLGKVIAMAYIEPAHAAVGKKLSVEVGRNSTPAHVVALPFYRRKK